MQSPNWVSVFDVRHMLSDFNMRSPTHSPPPCESGSSPFCTASDVPPKLRCGLGVPQNHASFTHLAGLAMAANEVGCEDVGSLSFEITAYEYGDEEVDYEDADEDAASTVSEDVPPPPPPLDLDDDEDADSFWPSMPLPTSERPSERLSERLSSTSERFSGELPPLLPQTAIFTAFEMQEIDTLPASPCPAQRGRRVRPPPGESVEQPIMSLDDVLARRDVAATVLTSGVGGLPALPIHLARDILDSCIPIVPSLADFANTAKVDLSACLAATSIDVARRMLTPDHAEVIAWLMRRSLWSALVWGSVPAAKPHLLELDASGNALGSRGASVIGNALPLAPYLRRLRLNDCLLCSAGGSDTTGLVEVISRVHTEWTCPPRVPSSCAPHP